MPENLELTEANYTVAVNLLKAMYGKPDVLIEAHTHKLDTLQPVNDMSYTAALRCFQLTIQSHINFLVTLGLNKPRGSPNMVENSSLDPPQTSH